MARKPKANVFEDDAEPQADEPQVPVSQWQPTGLEPRQKQDVLRRVNRGAAEREGTLATVTMPNGKVLRLALALGTGRVVKESDVLSWQTLV
jgi:hypothetical protein